MIDIVQLVRANQQIYSLSIRANELTVLTDRKALALSDNNGHIACCVENAEGPSWDVLLYAGPRVCHLTLEMCFAITVEWLQRVSASLPYLLSVSIQRCEISFSLHELREIFPHCDELQSNTEKWSRAENIINV